MSDISNLALPGMEDLLHSDEDQLFNELGLRAKAMGTNIQHASEFNPHIEADEKMMGLGDELKKLGRRIFKRWEQEAYKLICGASDEDAADRSELQKSFGADAVSVAAVMSAFLVTNLGAAPAIAAVISALVIKRLFNPAYEEFCKAWGERLDADEEAA